MMELEEKKEKEKKKQKIEEKKQQKETENKIEAIIQEIETKYIKRMKDFEQQEKKELENLEIEKKVFFEDLDHLAKEELESLKDEKKRLEIEKIKNPSIERKLRKYYKALNMFEECKSNLEKMEKRIKKMFQDQIPKDTIDHAINLGISEYLKEINSKVYKKFVKKKGFRKLEIEQLKKSIDQCEELRNPEEYMQIYDSRCMEQLFPNEKIPENNKSHQGKKYPSIARLSDPNILFSKWLPTTIFPDINSMLFPKYVQVDPVFSKNTIVMTYDKINELNQMNELRFDIQLNFLKYYIKSIVRGSFFPILKELKKNQSYSQKIMTKKRRKGKKTHFQNQTNNYDSSKDYLRVLCFLYSVLAYNGKKHCVVTKKRNEVEDS